jgi:hypothetical protein
MLTIAREATMKNMKYLAGSIAALMIMAAIAKAQAPQDNSKDTTPLQVTIIFNEYDGTKRVSTLPYQMACNANPHQDTSSLRLGLRVPIAAGSFGKDQTNVQYTYQDVGTDIDCHATAAPQGGFLVGLGLKRNVVYPPNESPKPTEWTPGSPLTDRPIFGGFEANVKNLLLRDGESVQAATATDPVSGHVWKVDVSLKAGK